jgi:cytochrome P450
VSQESEILSSTVSKTEAKYNFPPGPAENMITRALQQRRWINPIELFSELAARFQDIAHYKVGSRHTVLLNHPEYIREVLVVQHANFIKERTQQRARMLLLGEGMITTDGPQTRRQRQVAQPAFHRQKVPVHAAEIVRRTIDITGQWRNGIELDLYGEMMRLTLALVAKTLFNTEIEDEVHELNAAVCDIMNVYNAIVLLPGIQYLLKVPFTPLRKFVNARRKLYDSIDRMIASHRQGSTEKDDLLTMMLAAQADAGWSDGDLRDQVLTVFLAGYETTAIALTWTMYWISQQPEVERRLHSEIDNVLGDRPPTYDDLPKLNYTEMVLAESMRLYPPAWAMGREAVNDFQIGPYYLPAGTTVVMSQYVTHRDPRYFPDPLRFDPERFTPEAKASRQRFTYFPFGMGPRQCIGEAFAWMETMLIISTTAQKWKLRLAPEQRVVPEPLFTLRPKYGMRMIPERR